MTTQLDCSIGLKKETEYGVPVVVDQFPEFLNDPFEYKPTFNQGAGMRVGARLDRAGVRSLSKVDASGSITVEAPTKGLGVFLGAALGVVTNTAVPTQAGVFQQVHTPTKAAALDSYAIQKGIPLLGSAEVKTQTFPGSVCASLELTAKASGIVEVTTTWTSREVLTEEDYAPPAYPVDLELYEFSHGDLMIGGTVTPPTATALADGGVTVANITDISAKWDNGLDAKGWNMGGAGKRSRKPVVGKAACTGKMGAEFDSTTLQDAYLDQDGLSLLLTFTHPSTIGVSAHPVLQLLIPTIKLEGELANSNGGDPIAQSIGFTGLEALVAGQSEFYLVYVSTDTTP